MATYPGALPTIPDDGTWTHSQVGDEIEAIAAELGTNPSAAFTTVDARVGAAEDRITTVEAAASTAGVEVGSGQLTTDYDIKGQTTPTTFTDISLSMTVPAQTRAYNIWLSGTAVSVTNASFTGPKYLQVFLRIVDSGVTVAPATQVIPLVYPVSAAQTLLWSFATFVRIPAGQASTTWKVQARTSVAIDTNITTLAIYNSTALQSPVAGHSKSPLQFQAITV